MTDRYSPVQSRADNDSTDFIIRSGPALYIADATYLEDGGRSIDLASRTLMAKRASSQKWRSFVNEAATNGEAIPAGIYVGPTIPAADIAAGDVKNLEILLFGAWFDASRLIIENAKTLETVIGTGTIHAKTVRDYLFYRALIPLGTSTSSGGEN